MAVSKRGPKVCTLRGGRDVKFEHFERKSMEILLECWRGTKIFT